MTHEEELNKAIKKYVDARLDKTYEPYGEHRQKQLSKFNAYDLEEAIEYGAKWQKEQDENSFRKFKEHTDNALISIEEAREQGRQEMREQMMKEAEKPCHTVEEWMEHIKNADQLTKDIFSKGPYNVLYDALNHPYRDCYDAIKEFGELCYQTARQDMMKEAVGGQVFGATDVIAFYEGKVYVVSNLVQDTDYNLHPNDKVHIIFVKED